MNRARGGRRSGSIGRVPFVIGLAALCSVPRPALAQEAPDSVLVERDVVYGTDQVGSRALGLDVYRVSGRTATPVVILLHGGSGSKDDADYFEVSRRLAANGMVVFNATYVGGNPRSYSADGGLLLRGALESVVCAVRYASAHAIDFGGDATRVAILGHSAGGYFGLLAALLGEDSARPWEGLPETPGSGISCAAADGNAEVTGFVGFNGAYFVFAFFGMPDADPALWEAVNPANYAELHPSLATHFLLGATDPSTPPRHVEMTEAFSARRRALGFDAAVTVVDAEHDFSFAPPSWATTLEAIQSVLRRR